MQVKRAWADMFSAGKQIEHGNFTLFDYLVCV